MRVLAIDTASPLQALALVETGAGAEPLATARALPEQAAEALPAAVNALLAERGAPLAGVDRIAVLSGPGSFTGLRAGAAFARGLARGLGVPLLAVGTFPAASEAAPGGDVTFLLDAGRGEVHRARRRGGALVEDEAPLPRETALREAAGGPVVEIAASGTRLAVALGRLAARERAAPGALAPAYGRRSAAEEKADGTGRGAPGAGSRS
jgi:tRNA threonylcarbamoyl adenosine modification protein YeaZ